MNEHTPDLFPILNGATLALIANLKRTADLIDELKSARDFIADYDPSISTETLSRVVKRLARIDAAIAKTEGK